MLYNLLLLGVALTLPIECMYNGVECSGHGKCHISTDGTPSYCVCDEDFTFSKERGCVATACYNDILDMVCNNGKCDEVDGKYKCTCPPDLYYVAGQCTTLACITKGDDGKATVCSEHGYCGYDMFGGSKCVCLPEYDDNASCKVCNLTNAEIIDGVCTSKKCLTVLSDDSKELCGGCGTCSRVGFAYDLAYRCTCPNTDSCKEVALGVCGIDACISDTQLKIVCNEKGICDQTGCHCNDGYSGPTCLINDRDPDECQAKYVRIDGECVPEACIPRIPGNNVCGGPQAGECIFADTMGDFYCRCFDGYINTRDTGHSFDYQCVPMDCISEMGVCFQGECLPGQGPYSCVCSEGFHNEPTTGECASDSCYTDSSRDPNKVCSGHGICKYYGCACNPGYGGDICNEDAPIYCFEGQVVVGKECVFADCVSYTPEPGVCGGFGACVNFEGYFGHPDMYECQCDEGTVYDRDYLCLPSACLSADGQVCPHGSCQKIGGVATCVCKNGYKNINGACYPLSCLIIIDDAELVCAGNGTCDLDSGVCTCNELYHGEHCDVPKDHDIVCQPGETLIGERCVSNYCIFNGVECSGHGRCDKTLSDGPRCACDLMYILSVQLGCVPLGCYDQETDTICTNGQCIDDGQHSHCQCDADFTLVKNNCIHNNCLTDSTVCSGNGNCGRNSGGEYSCQCDYLHSGSKCEVCSSDATMIDGICASGSCITTSSSGQTTVCSGMGVCRKDSVIDSAHCSCRSPFILAGEKCVAIDCYAGEPIGAPCNGKGTCGLSSFCSDPATCHTGQCFCDTGYDGVLCNVCASNYINVPGYGCIAKTCYSNGLVCSSAGECVNGQCQCVSGYAPSGAECVKQMAMSTVILIGGGVGAAVLIIAIILGIVFGIRKNRQSKGPVSRATNKKGRALAQDGAESEVLVPSDSDSDSDSATTTATDEIP